MHLSLVTFSCLDAYDRKSKQVEEKQGQKGSQRVKTCWLNGLEVCGVTILKRVRLEDGWVLRERAL